MSMSDRIAVLSGGEIHQFDSPSNLYDRPATEFVSSFVGTCNHLPGEVLGQADKGYLVKVPGGELEVTTDHALTPQSPITVAIRPENLRVQTQSHRHTLTGTVAMCLPLGAVMTYDVALGSDLHIKLTQPRTLGTQPLVPGDQIHLDLVSPDACSVFPA